MSERNLAAVLAGVAGYADVVGYLTLRHVFTAHMTGNASKLGASLARGDLEAAWPLLVLPAAFAVGVALGTLLVDAGRRWALFAAESLLIVVYMALGHAERERAFAALIAIAATALGMQAAAVGKIAGVTVRTSYVTGVLTSLVQGAVRRLRDTREDLPLVVLAAVWAAYVGGATLGAAVLGRAGWWCLAVPAVVLAAVAAAERLGA